MITSTANKKVKQIVQWQTKTKQRKQDGVFLAEGFKMYEEAPVELVREVYISEAALVKAKEDKELFAKLQQTGFEEVTEEVFARMSDTQSPQGILTVMDRPRYLLEDLVIKENPMFVILENLQDPGNLGTIVRTGEGAGITAVILTEQTVDLFNPKTIRSTMGSIYRVPFVYVKSLEQAVKVLREHGVRTYAAHLQGTTYYQNMSFREPVAFLIGNEGNGLTDEATKLADAYVKIPMEGSVESLNAAVATALLMYETHRQRSE